MQYQCKLVSSLPISLSVILSESSERRRDLEYSILSVPYLKESIVDVGFHIFGEFEKPIMIYLGRERQI